MTDDREPAQADHPIDVLALVARLRRWVEENQPAIQRFREVVTEFLARLPEWRSNLEANTLLVRRGLDAISSKGYGSVGYFLSASNVAEFANMSSSDLESRLYEETVKPEFRLEMIDLYSSIGLRPGRQPLIEEALDLHREARFGGAVTLLYSQLEGIVTDALLHLGHASRENGRLLSKRKADLPGLASKLRVADNEMADEAEIFAQLMKAVLTTSDPQSTIPKSRNSVLHGNDIEFATRQRSTQMVLWTFALLVQLKGALQ